jgi:tRNA-modifying protein YgfZ
VESAHLEPESSAQARSGDVFHHQRLLLAGDAVVDCSSRELLTVTGPDRLIWLNSLITQKVDDLTPGQTKESMILSPQGKIEYPFLMTDDGDTTFLLTESGLGEPLRAWLQSMVFRMDAQVSLISGKQVLGFLTEISQEVELHPAVIEFVDPWPSVGEGSIGYASEPHLGASWSLTYRVYDHDAKADLDPLVLVPESSLTGLMIAVARPTMAEVDEKSLPHELDWLRTSIHLEKGCYRGQESVAKVHNLGHPPRRLTLLHLDGSESTLPDPGDAVFIGDKAVGIITRAAWHYELGPIALALLKRNTSLEAALSVEHEATFIPATGEVIVPPDAGATRATPRLPRLGQRG